MPKTQLRIELLGHVTILDGGDPVRALTSPRRRSLLAYLVLHHRERVDRAQLSSQFWPDTEDAQARTNLRRVLHHLRGQLPHAERVLDVSPQAVGWNADGPATVDVIDFERAVEEAGAARSNADASGEIAALDRAVALYRGELLPTYEGEWVELERSRLRTHAVWALGRLSELYEAAGDLDAAVSSAEHRIRLDRLDEGGYRRLMELHLRAGNRAAGVHAFHRCAGVLQRELDIGPGPATMAAYDRLMESGEARAPRPVAPAASRDAPTLVGRENALAELTAAWETARAGHASAVLIQGEAGIGKTRLTEALANHCARQGATVIRGRAYASEDRLGYALATEWLRAPATVRAVTDLSDVWRTELARLLPELGTVHGPAPGPGNGAPDAWQRRRLLEALVRAILATPPPRLLVADDLQWADVDSLDALRLLTHLEPAAAVLIAGTARSEELVEERPLERFLLGLRADGRLTDIELERLDNDQTARLAASVAGRTLSAVEAERLHTVTEGVPLFVVETLRAGEGSAPFVGENAALPPRVRAVLAERLRQLSTAARDLTDLAATIGRPFRFSDLRDASDLPEEDLVQALDESWRRRIIREHGDGAYDFRHDALREAAYRTMTPARRRLLHRRIARALDRRGEAPSGAAHRRLARHYELGGETVQAVEAYRRAASAANAVHSHHEALELLGRALTILEGLPPSEDRDRRELSLLLAQAAPLRATGGWTVPALERAMRRASELAERLDDEPALRRALVNLVAYLYVTGRLRPALAVQRRLERLNGNLPYQEDESDTFVAAALLTFGDLEPSLERFARSERRHAPGGSSRWRTTFGADLAVFTAAYHSHALWLNGLADRACAVSRRALRVAEALRHPYSQTLAHAYAAALAYMRRDRAACREHARDVVALCERHGFAYYIHWGHLFAAWATPSGDAGADAARIERAIRDLDAENAGVRRPFYLSVLALVLSRTAQWEAARHALAEARARAEASGEAWWTPEIERLLALLQPEAPARVAGLEEALRRATAIRAWALGHRAAVSLAAALRDQGEAERARHALREVLSAAPRRGHGRDRRRAEHALERLGG